ncbi:MAG: energy transducer TonB [Kofleriaceae bacterium]|nr:energy transducer TonB [Kofleriaceae bacterium]
MQCFRCQTENVDGARFCGQCGAHFGTAPPLAPSSAPTMVPPSMAPGASPAGASMPPQVRYTDPTRQIEAAPMPSGPLPALSRGGRPAVKYDDAPAAGASLDGSLGDSLRVPGRPGGRGRGRGLVIAAVLLLDVGMVAGGVALMTRGSGGGGGDGGAAGPVAGRSGGDGGAANGDGATTTGDGVAIGGGSGSGSGKHGGGTSGGGKGSPSSTGGGTSSSGGTGASAGSSSGGAGSSGSSAGSSSGSSGSSGSGSSAGSSGSSGSSGSGSSAGSSGSGTSRPIDAGVPIDARAPVDPYVVDAAPILTAAPDAAVALDPDEIAAGVASQVSIQATRSESKLSTCYTRATKGLPDDQPLEGEVDIAFQVMPTGETRGIEVTKNTTSSTTLADCVIEVVRGWTVAPFTGDPVDFLRPFRFRPSG